MATARMTVEQARALQRTCRSLESAARLLRNPGQSDENVQAAALRYLRASEAHAAEIAKHDFPPAALDDEDIRDAGAVVAAADQTLAALDDDAVQHAESVFLSGTTDLLLTLRAAGVGHSEAVGVVSGRLLTLLIFACGGDPQRDPGEQVGS